MKKWRKNKNNREKEKERDIKYYKDNKEYCDKIHKQWRENNPKKDRFIIYKYNAKQRGLILGITFDEFVKILKKPCHYCGEKGYGIDRIDSSIGYLKDNIVSCCSMCNYMKRAYSEGEFISQCAKIYTHWNERK